MYFRDMIKKSFQNIRRRRRSTVLNIVLLTLSLIVVLIAEMFGGAFDVSLKGMFFSPSTRTILIQYSEDEDLDNENKLQKQFEEYFEGDDRIAYIGEYYGTVSFDINLSDIYEDTDEDNYYMWIIEYNSQYNQYIDGNNNVNIDKYEIYVPRYINGKNQVMNDFNTKIEYIDGRKLVGKTVTIEKEIKDFCSLEVLETRYIELKIKGTYDNFALGKSAFEAIVSPELLKDLTENTWVFTEGSQKEKEEYDEYKRQKKLQIVVKDYEDVDDIILYLKGKTGEEYDTLAAPADTVYFVGNIIDAVKYAGFIFVILSMINITFSLVKSISKRRKEFALLSAIGYRNRHIYGILLFEIIIIGVFSLMISTVIYNIARFVIHWYVYSNMDSLFASISFSIPLHIWIIRILMFGVSLFAAFMFGADRVRRIVPAKVLKENG